MEIPGCFMRALGFLSSPVAPNESITTKLIQRTFSFQPIKNDTFFSPKSELENNVCTSLLSFTCTWRKHLFLVLNECTEFLII